MNWNDLWDALWPWRVIRRLKAEVATAKEELEHSIALGRDWERRGYNRHFSEWLMTANIYYGAESFTTGETAQMMEFHNRGYGWREALDMLVIYNGKTGRYAR